jgi:hypothetical protein
MIISTTYFIQQMQGSIQGVQDNDALTQAIMDVTAQIESYLGRKVSIQKYSESIKSYRVDEGKYLPIYRPVVYAYEHGTNGVQIFAEEGGVEYLSGWLMAGESEEDIIDRFDLAYDTELLALVPPADMQRVALKLTAYELTSSAQNNYGRASKTVVTGGTTATIERQDSDFVDREFAKLIKYAVMVI